MIRDTTMTVSKGKGHHMITTMTKDTTTSPDGDRGHASRGPCPQTVVTSNYDTALALGLPTLMHQRQGWPEPYIYGVFVQYRNECEICKNPMRAMRGATPQCEPMRGPFGPLSCTCTRVSMLVCVCIYMHAQGCACVRICVCTPGLCTYAVMLDFGP